MTSIFSTVQMPDGSGFFASNASLCGAEQGSNARGLSGGGMIALGIDRYIILREPLTLRENDAIRLSSPIPEFTICFHSPNTVYTPISNKVASVMHDT